MLKYLEIQPGCDIAFGTFMVVWLVTRHIFYSLVLWSIYSDLPQEIKYGCYWGPTNDLKGPIDPPDRFSHLLQPFYDPVGLVCWNGGIGWAFLITLLALQVILLLWFVMIIRVAVKVVRGGEAEDSRSDDEDSQEAEEEEKKARHEEKRRSKDSTEDPSHQEAIETEYSTYRRVSPPKRFRKSGGVTSGVALPSDRKELLGRIGCDKGS